VVAESRPQRVVDAFGIPDEHARVQERGLLALVEAVGALELEQLAEVLFGRRPLSARESPLRPSVVAVDRLRDVDPAELLQRVVEDPLPEDALPRAHERLRDDGDVEANRLCLGTRRAVEPRVLEVRRELRIVDRRRVDVADSSHDETVTIDREERRA
jgi:hypothetical protein